jgi:hypothetical protein
MTLLDEVRGQVAAHVQRGEMLTDLARDAGVRYSWLRMFANGSIPNPGVVQIERLRAHFRRRSRRRAARVPTGGVAA